MFEFVVLAVLVLTGGVLAGAEMALVTARRGRLEQAAERGSVRARAALRLRQNPERFLASAQVGITLVGAIAAAFGGSAMAARLEPTLRELGCGAASGEIAFGLVVLLVTYLSVVFGELVPKSLALRYADRYSLAIARPMVLIGQLARPVVWLLTTSSNAVLRLFGDHTNFVEGKLTRDDLEHLVEEASTAGGIDVATGRLVARALEFAELRVGDVMVSRRFVDALPEDADEAALRAAMVDKGHRRVPVYRDTIDHVIGYVLREDVLSCLWAGDEPRIGNLLREPFFVPALMRADRALRELQDRHLQMAIVVDELGNLAGLVTLEDLLEEFVGEIYHETDAPPARPVHREASGVYRLAGTLPLREVWRELQVELPERGAERTVGGLLVALAGDRVPTAGERFQAGPGIELEVVEASPRRVRVARLRRRDAEPQRSTP